MIGAKGEAGIGGCLRELRMELGWSQVDLARGVGLSAPAVSRIETGKQRPDSARLRLLLGTMGFSADSCRLLGVLMQRGFL